MILEPEAKEELIAAALWYEDQRPGLGDEFVDAVDGVLNRIEEAPDSFPPEPFDGRARRGLVKRFPYAVVYVTDLAGVRVIAIMHLKRLPRYWTSRV
jgi:plasmid stabilization system protein ParE